MQTSFAPPALETHFIPLELEAAREDMTMDTFKMIADDFPRPIEILHLRSSHSMDQTLFHHSRDLFLHQLMMADDLTP